MVCSGLLEGLYIAFNSPQARNYFRVMLISVCAMQLPCWHAPELEQCILWCLEASPQSRSLSVLPMQSESLPCGYLLSTLSGQT